MPYADKQGRSQNSPFQLDLSPKRPAPAPEAPPAVVPVPAVETVASDIEAPSEPAAAPEESTESAPETAESELEPDEALVAVRETSEEPETTLPYMPEIRAKVGFTFFSPGSERILSDVRSLDNKYDINGELELKQRFSDLVSARLGFERDSLLMNRFFARTDFDLNLLSLSAGLYFGAFNELEDTFSSGASIGLSARIFDFVAAFRVDVPLGDTLSYAQSYNTFNLDWYPSWAHLGLSLTGRTLFQKTLLGADITSEWLQYALFGEKTFGRFTPRLEFGYQELTWIFSGANSITPAKYHYASLYVGMGTSFSLLDTLSLNLHVQVPVYPFVYTALQTSPFFFNAMLGVTWTPRARSSVQQVEEVEQVEEVVLVVEVQEGDEVETVE
jgi:hypothetical protein